MRARSVRRPSTGWRSILKSPEWRMIPCGVWKAVAKAWGTEWVTGMNSTSHGPIRRRSPSRTGMNSARSAMPGLVDPVAGQGQGQLGAVDGDREVPQQVGQAAGVVLVAVGQDDPVDPVGVLPQVGEVGQDQVDAGHVRVREHDPHVEDQDPPVDLDAGAVAADLPQAAEEDDPDRRPAAPRPSRLSVAFAADRGLRPALAVPAGPDRSAFRRGLARRLAAGLAFRRVGPEPPDTPSRAEPDPVPASPGALREPVGSGNRLPGVGGPRPPRRSRTGPGRRGLRGRCVGQPALADRRARGPGRRPWPAPGWGTRRWTRSGRTRARRWLTRRPASTSPAR